MRRRGPAPSAPSAPPPRVLLAMAGGLLLAGCSGGILDPRGPVGDAERLILLDSLGIMLAIVIPTIGVALGIAWWFRESNARARYRPTWAYSGRIELIVWSIPVLVILFLGGIIWIGSHALDPARPLPGHDAPLELEVVSLDWKWLFIYPAAAVASVNELVIPAGVPVHFTLTSASVMNGFFVPQLGGMIATMNGMATQLALEAAAPGTFYGESTQFSGDGFADMHFAVRALPADGFAQWLRSARSAGPTLDRDAYRQLAVQSRGVAPHTYRAVDPGLFDAIVTRSVAPGAGPVAGPEAVPAAVPAGVPTGVPAPAGGG